MYGKCNMETYITIYKINSQWEFAVWLRKPKQGLYINTERWGGREMGGSFKREGRYVYVWVIHVEFDRKQQNSVKQLSFNKKLINFKKSEHDTWETLEWFLIKAKSIPSNPLMH